MVEHLSVRANDIGDPVLTRREAEVAALVMQGHSNKAIALRLGLEEGTVKIHLNKIYGKLGVSGRAELMLNAIWKASA
jgi:DNA-binding CsgD family transcriptional regulator